MTLSRKGSRSIIVDGVPYRWMIRRKATWNDITTEMVNMPHGAKLRVIIEKENIHGTLLVVTTDQPRMTKYKMIEKAGVVRPSDVVCWINEALAAGWAPEKRGPALERDGKARPAADNLRLARLS